MNILFFYILTADVWAMSSITVDENSLKAKPDVNCQLIEREDFTKAFTEGSALVELHRILQNEIKVSWEDVLMLRNRLLIGWKFQLGSTNQILGLSCNRASRHICP